MTICHIDTRNLSQDSKWIKVKKYIKKIWSQTCVNGLFVTVWTGSEEQKAFVGVALNKTPSD